MQVTNLLVSKRPQLIKSEPKKRQLNLNATLQELNLYDASIAPECPGAKVAKILEENPMLPGIIMVKQGRFIGMISRRTFFEQMSRPYSLELFLKRPIYILYELTYSQPLIFHVRTSIVLAIRECLQRSPESIYEPLVVQVRPRVYKLVDMDELLVAQLQIHELTMTALQTSQQALFYEKEKAQVTLESIGDAVITTDAFGRIEFLNPVAEKLTGWQLKEARGKPLTEVFQIINERNRKQIVNPVEKVLKYDRVVDVSKETILIARNGTEIAIDNSAAPIRSPDGQTIGAVLVFRDVTPERNLTRELSWQASHDSLTGLVNRREFERQVEQALLNAKTSDREHTLCYLDLDQFKIVNDTCGHIAGDQLLREITTLLKSRMRPSDTIARLGGDEFGLLLYNCSLNEGIKIAEKLHQSMQKFRFGWQDKTFTVGVSIGLAAINTESQSLTSVLSAADAACYAAKNKGRDRIQVYQADDIELAQQQGEMQWVARINKAFEENRFRLYYQKIVPIDSGSENSNHYEVLLRMIDESGNLVSPMAFIPAAERYNLMPTIDRWVISTLFAAQAEHLRATSHLYNPNQYMYAINLSGASINDEHFIDFLHQQFLLHQIPPEIICFEITETVAIVNLNKATKFIHSLKKIGCRFALDDFGSGMSSFAYLKTLPVDYLKIDGGFVKDIVGDRIAGAMVEAINRIGQVMGIKTIAEFVENDDILEKVKILGVNYAQGYGIAKPQPFAFDFGI